MQNKPSIEHLLGLKKYIEDCITTVQQLKKQHNLDYDYFLVSEYDKLLKQFKEQIEPNIISFSQDIEKSKTISQNISEHYNQILSIISDISKNNDVRNNILNDESLQKQVKQLILSSEIYLNKVCTDKQGNKQLLIIKNNYKKNCETILQKLQTLSDNINTYEKRHICNHPQYNTFLDISNRLYTVILRFTQLINDTQKTDIEQQFSAIKEKAESISNYKLHSLKTKITQKMIKDFKKLNKSLTYYMSLTITQQTTDNTKKNIIKDNNSIFFNQYKQILVLLKPTIKKIQKVPQQQQEDKSKDIFHELQSLYKSYEKIITDKLNDDIKQEYNEIIETLSSIKQLNNNDINSDKKRLLNALDSYIHLYIYYISEYNQYSSKKFNTKQCMGVLEKLQEVVNDIKKTNNQQYDESLSKFETHMENLNKIIHKNKVFDYNKYKHRKPINNQINFTTTSKKNKKSTQQNIV